MSQEEIERLLGQTKDVAAPAEAKSAAALAQGAARMAAAEGDEDRLLAQDDIERLLHEAGRAPAGPAAAVAAPAIQQQQFAPNQLADEGSMTTGDIEFLLNQAEEALESINASSSSSLPQGVVSYRLEEFSGSAASSEAATIDLIRDVELDLKIELGRTNMYLEDVLKLRKGSVVPLDKLAGDPVDIYVNGRLIARGEVLVLNDNFCVRVAELIAGAGAFA
jgi:flagellar motor switch protein FliN/FliY